MGINGRMHVLIWQVSMIWCLLAEGLPSVNVATTTDNKKMTPCPFLQFLSGTSILVALSLWCIIFICVVYDGRNVWVLSDHSWNTCMYRLNVVGMIKVVDIILDEVRKCVTLTVGSCLCTARSKMLSCLVVFAVLQVSMQLCWNVLLLCDLTVFPTECHFGNRFFGTWRYIL